MWRIRSRFFLGVLLDSCQFPGFSSPVTSQQASLNWLPVSIMSGLTCIFFARVDEDAVLSDSAHSGGVAADAVVLVALHRPWVRLDSEALVRWSSEIRQDFSGGGPTSGSSLSARSVGCLPCSTCSPTLPMSVGLSSQSFLEFRGNPEPISVSAASMKVACVNRPVRNHTFSPLLALFFS